MLQKTWSMAKKTLTLHIPSTARGPLPLAVLNVYAGDGSDVWRRCCELAHGDVPFALAAVGGLDWERNMTPWPAEPATRNEAPYAGGAGAHLAWILAEALPAVERELASAGIEVSYRVIAGYSLAGLFALWAPWQTGAFARAASASGSLWYEGFLEYAAGQEPIRVPDAAYLSLGSKEHRTPNRLMRHVRERTEQMAGLLRGLGARTTFELNPGNHFQDPDLRMARALLSVTA